MKLLLFLFGNMGTVNVYLQKTQGIKEPLNTITDENNYYLQIS